MTIKNSSISDIDAIFKQYLLASKYQQSKKKVIVWPNFDRKMVENEIAEKRQFQLLIDGEIACVWAITFSDPQIWEERNKDRAVYIHRIATNPEYRGNNFVHTIVKWAKTLAASEDLQFIRLDTLGENKKLIAHYKNVGFDFLGLFHLKDTSNLPEHYKKAAVSLFEINLYKK
ncbi:GNAT family N-acetyltransferase [Polaribacter sp.]|nr:GNAT family N-acetyltransferase [Polaribacter sp.]|tara:strand:- start:1865 stop:2383 length:519 start_codon:yes stop_codon:yes gene_type:complete